jgi:hypothetical protein
MNISIIDSAEAEFVEAVQRYNKESEGLGYEFAAEVKRTILRIKEFPHAWPLFSKRTHRCRSLWDLISAYRRQHFDCSDNASSSKS